MGHIGMEKATDWKRWAHLAVLPLVVSGLLMVRSGEPGALTASAILFSSGKWVIHNEVTLRKGK